MEEIKGYLAFLMLAASALFLLIALVLFFAWRGGRRKAREVQAKVVENVRRRDQRGRPLYFPLLEFEWEGEAKRMELPMGTNWEQHQPSERVMVYYDPRHDQLVAKPSQKPAAIGLFLGILSGVLLLCGSMLLGSLL